MKGSIYPTKYGYQVRFGRKIGKHFKTLAAAERFLTGLRYETDRGTFDLRDYRSNMPLGFSNLADKWLELKRQQVKPRSFNNLRNYIEKAAGIWGNANIKNIRYGHIEDFLFSQPVSSKTCSNIKSCLHSFFKWVSRREGIPMPDFPEVAFELGWRNIIDIDTQQAIIEEVKRITWEVNHKIWFGIHCLATYVSVRPGELMAVKERFINIRLGGVVIPHPKEKRPKIVYLLPEDIEFIKSLPQGLPDLYFFRHGPGRSGVASGAKFGPRYLYKWWKKACSSLGIEGVDLYGGTRHSTVTALGRICTPEEVKDATGHTSEAFERYFQNRQGRALEVTRKIKRLGSTQPLINISEGGEKGKILKFNE
jgi:hypothetical protein